jgi:hypothetical protein
MPSICSNSWVGFSVTTIFYARGGEGAPQTEALCSLVIFHLESFAAELRKASVSSLC